METNRKILFISCGAGIIAAAFLFFHFFYAYHLFFREQILLFLNSKEYFLSYFNRPAWLSCYTGDFLTQFFYLRGGGPLILALLLLLEWLLYSKIIRTITKSTLSFQWAMLPAGIDFVLYCNLSHPVSVSVSVILSLILFIIYPTTANSKLAMAVAAALVIATYWLAGSAVFIFVSLIIAGDWMNNHLNGLKTGMLLLLALFVPYLSANHYLITITEAFLYPAVRPASLLPIPAIVITLVLAFMVNPKKQVHLVMAAIPLAFLIILATGISRFGNFKFEKILSLDSETYFGNTERVLHLSRKYKLKNRLSAYYTNIALSRLGKLPEYLLEFYQPAAQGLFLPVSPDESWQNILFSSEAFYLAGDLNTAQHSAMLGMTFSPHVRSSRMVKRLAEINLATHDYPAAAKYLRLLEKTLFHKKWAAKRMELIENGDEPAWLAEIRNRIAGTDTLRKPVDYLQSLNFIVDQNPANQIALDYLLCYHLLNKDLSSFQKVCRKHWKMIRQPLSSLYSEALLILLFRENAPGKKVVEYGISPEKLNDFIRYSNQYEKAKGHADQISETYRQSYWYYYHFAAFRENKNQIENQ